MPRVGFEPTISAGERPKTYALDRAASGTGNQCLLVILMYQYLTPSAIFMPNFPCRLPEGVQILY